MGLWIKSDRIEADNISPYCSAFLCRVQSGTNDTRMWMRMQMQFFLDVETGTDMEWNQIGDRVK